MKKILSKEVHICDACGQEGYCYVCVGCGVEYCYDCKKTLMADYHHGVCGISDIDGYFCLKCNSTPPPKVKDLLHAYFVIKNLEQEGWSKDFQMRSKVAEETVKKIRKELGL